MDRASVHAAAGAAVGSATDAPAYHGWLGAGRWWTAALGLLFAVALGTRTLGLGGAVTEDEDQWIARSGTFARGLAEGEWRRTYLTGHPGVTTMWLTTLTLGVERARPFERLAGAPDVTTEPGFLAALGRARVPFALLQAALVVVAAALVARLLGRATGLIAGLLLAAEPFWAGVGPVVGMDGLLTGLLLVSVLALLLACGFGGAPEPAARARLGWAVLAGATFGLAFLTKTTAAFVGPLVVALLALTAWRAWRTREGGALAADGSPSSSMTGPPPSVGRWWRGPLLLGAAWGIAGALTIWLVWPAAWGSPVGTVWRALTFSARLGGTPHGPGNFLLGEPVDDPGPLFYPVALVARLGPGTVVGLLLLFAFGAVPPARRIVWPLLGWAGLFVVLLALAPKKVDRYLLSILPVLGVLAAVGFREAAARLPLGAVARVVAVALVALGLQLWPLALAGPFPLAAYNPLVGGVRFAERAIPVGWGDGLDVAAERIRELAGGRTVVTAIWSPLRVSFGAHAPGPVISERQIAQADFYVDYVHARQRRLTPRQLVSRTPDAVVTIGGVEYARIYRLR